MTEATTALVEDLPLASDVRTLGELRGASMRRRRRMEPLAEVTGSAAATAIVALQTPAAPLAVMAMTFLVFLLAGATLGRRSHWTSMLPFARTLIELLCRGLAAAVVWGLIEVAAVTNSPEWALLWAAVAATATATVARRLTAPAAKRIAVVGSRRSAEQLHQELLACGMRDQEVVGVVAAGIEPVAAGSSDVPVLGTIAALDELLERSDIDILVIDGEASRIEVFDRLADTCLHLPVRVCELTQYYEDTLGHVPVTEIGSAWFRYIMHPRFRAPDTAAKRTLDLAVVVVAGLAFLPVLALCALLIKLHDGGPVLFRQQRIGSRGREFTLLKLRTMCSGPEVARWSSSDDERVTPVGRVLRRTHLDEVPQLINVLRGEMSVVGPRPEQPAFVERLERTVPHYSRRHLIQPGLTGWAQVRCGYAGSDTGSAWKLCHDLFYLKHHSLALDLAILAETARTLVADRQYPSRGCAVVPTLVAVPADDSAALVPRRVAAD